MYSDVVIGARITTIFDDEHGLYGAKRIAASLKEDTEYTPDQSQESRTHHESHGT